MIVKIKWNINNIYESTYIARFLLYAQYVLIWFTKSYIDDSVPKAFAVYVKASKTLWTTLLGQSSSFNKTEGERIQGLLGQ